MTALKKLVIVAGLLSYFFPGQASQAAIVGSRLALQAELAGPGTLEDFESYDVAPLSADLTGEFSLDSSTIVSGQGPGLVVNGVVFKGDPFSELQWNGSPYFGSPSKEIMFTNDSDRILIDFTSPVDAFGVDVRALHGFGGVAAVVIYGTDDATVIGIIAGVPLSVLGTPRFIGWEDAAGIGSIQIVEFEEHWGWSPIIDNLEFGSPPIGAVPEPSSMTLLALGGMGLLFLRRQRLLQDNPLLFPILAP